MFIPWIYAARPKTLIASISPIICSLIIIPDTEVINLGILAFIFISALSIQIGTNYVNDLYDYLKGADNECRLGPKRMVSEGIISIDQMKRGIKFVFFIAVISGIPLVYYGGWPILFIGISGLCLAYFYTAGPSPIAYSFTGDFFVLLYFGVFAVSGSYYLLTGEIDLLSVLMGLSIGSLNVILLLVNNIRDYHTDKENNKNTIVVTMGLFFGKAEIIFMFIVGYLSIFIIAYNFSSINLFYIYLCSVPLFLNILYDIIYKSGKLLNKTLPKISLFMIIHCILIYIGF